MAFTPKDSPYDDGLMFQSPMNTGIGNWFKDQSQWRSLSDGTMGRTGASPNQYGGDVDQALANRYRDMAGYTYHGDDGKNYLLSGAQYTPATDQESAATNNYDIMFGGASGKGRAPGEMAYSTTQFKPGAADDMGAYNGSKFDMYDSKGRYVGGQIPHGLGDDKFATSAAIIAAMVASAGMAGAAMAPAAATTMGGVGAAGAGGATFGVVDTSLIGAGMEGLGGIGAAGAGSAGAGALDLGGGISMGADGAIGGSSGLGVGGSSISNAGILEGVGAGGLNSAAGGAIGVAPPTAPGYGAPVAGSGSGSGLTGALNQPLFEVPGIGGVSGQNLLGLGSTLMGGLSGGKGQSSEQTTTRDLPEYLQGPVGGLVGQANSLMNQQMGGGLLDTTTKKKKKPKEKRGLL